MQRSFIIGEEWLYYKIYCGAKTADILLVNSIMPLMEKLIKEKQIDKWFFIRYKDPENHIRLRLHFMEVNLLGHVIKELKNTLKPYIANDSINRLIIDTYKRELERYGGSTIDIAESLFYNDSHFIVSALTLGADEEQLILLMLKSMDDFLTNCGLNMARKLDFAVEQMGYYKEEQGVNKQVNKQLGKKFRERSVAINNFILALKPKEYNSIQVLLVEKSHQDKPIINQFLNQKKQNRESDSFNVFVGSLLHMSVNRAFRSQQRTYEMLLYDFLVRFYREKMEFLLAKNKKYDY